MIFQVSNVMTIIKIQNLSFDFHRWQLEP